MVAGAEAQTEAAQTIAGARGAAKSDDDQQNGSGAKCEVASEHAMVSMPADRDEDGIAPQRL